MTEPANPLRRQVAPIALFSGALGAALGFAGSRLVVGNGQSAVMIKLVEALTGQLLVSGPVLAAGIAASSAILAAAIVRAVVVHVLNKMQWVWGSVPVYSNFYKPGPATEDIDTEDIRPYTGHSIIYENNGWHLEYDDIVCGNTLHSNDDSGYFASNVYHSSTSTPLTNLRYWASSYNPIANTLDFTGFNGLEAIECFNCSPLQHVIVSNLPSLQRACFEDCDLQELDLSGNPNLRDLRGAVNAFPAILVGNGTGPNVWHWCTRDNPQLTQRFADIMTNFFALRDLFIWNDNQTGHLRVGSTNLTYVEGYNNHFSSADFSGQSAIFRCNLADNELTNLALEGCTGLRELDVRNNLLSSNALDSILASLDTNAPSVATVDLSNNAQCPSPIGYAHYSNLVARGVSVLVDWPESNDGRIDVPGGSNAITFVTIGQTPHMEIQIAGGAPDSIVWHWGDGTLTPGATVVHHDFGAAERHTNYVEVIPPDRVRYFGARRDLTGQGISAVQGAANFPRLDYLYLYQESIEELSLAGCSNLVQLHLADNPVPTNVCDQWFLDLDTAVTGAVTGADFYYPAARRSAASDAAWSNLAAKGFALWPF